jgi:hypothetical protein
MTHFATVEEWDERAKEGTSGDMVHNILGDWHHDRERRYNTHDSYEGN